MTTQERKIWNILRNRQFHGYRFLRQFVVDNYIVDFICHETKFIIEIDGGQHNDTQNISYDTKRTEFLESKGYKIIRFWNNEIDENMDGVYQKLEEIFNIENPS